MDDEQTYTAFAGHRRLAAGDRAAVVAALRAHLAADPAGAAGPVLVFGDATGRQEDLDLRPEAPPPRRAGPGRPRLGVVSREVSLLPRHWAWLEAQPGGISGALRRLVDEARRRDPGADRARAAREAAGRFMWAMAGDLPGFEEASRALYAGDLVALRRRTAGWPADVRDHLLRLWEGR